MHFRLKLERRNGSLPQECYQGEKEPPLHDVDADFLVLWKASIPHDPNLTDNVNNSSLVDDDGSPQVFTSHPNNKHFLSLSPVHRLKKKPIETTAPPIQLFHPVFGHFLDD
jgi:hypothetical protein